nr:unnamed protein product [Callosobruchus analis]
MSVRVAVPDVGQSRSDHRNILGVVMSIEDGFYRLGTVHGALKQLYARNEFELCKQEFIKLEDFKTDTLVMQYSLCQIICQIETNVFC